MHQRTMQIGRNIYGWPLSSLSVPQPQGADTERLCIHVEMPIVAIVAIVDECYEAATDASDYAGSISEGDSDPVYVELCDDQPEFCDDQRDSEFFDGVGAEAVEVPEYVPPDDVPLDDEAAKEKAARYEQTKRLFNRGKGARNAVGKVERYQYGPNPVVHCLCRHVLKLGPRDLWEATG